MKRFFYILLWFGVTSVLFFSGCKKEFDTPPVKEIPTGSTLTIADLRNMYQGQIIRFTEDKSVYAVVTADERSGNLYKNVYVKDNTGAINIVLLSSGGLYEGDSIRINLNKTRLSVYSDLLQLDSVDADNNIVKLATLIPVQPITLAIAQIDSTYESQLIQINNVEFSCNDLGKTYAEPVTKTSVNLTIKECAGKAIIVRTSGYASFAGTIVPSGNGTIIAILSRYNDTWQLYFRRTSEVAFTGTRCVMPSLKTINENFSSVTDGEDIQIAYWSNIATVGTPVWTGDVYNNSSYAEATAYKSSDASNEMWLITPKIQFEGSDTLSFQSAWAYTYYHNGLSVWISTDFDGCNVNTGKWKPVNATLAGALTPSFEFVDSGNLPLQGYFPQGYQGTYYIGFQYTGIVGSQETTYRIDNVQIKK